MKGSRASALPQRSGFTLVELLVVIGIISVLAALITPAVFNARLSARRAVIKSEIEMLHMSIMNYRNENGSYPPCVQFDTKKPPNNVAVKHLRRMFPHCDLYNSRKNHSTMFRVLRFIQVMHLLSGLVAIQAIPESTVFRQPVEKRYTTSMTPVWIGRGAVHCTKCWQITPYLYFDSSRYLDANTRSRVMA